MFKLFNRSKDEYFRLIPVKFNNEEEYSDKSDYFNDEIFKECKNLYNRVEKLNQEMREFVRKCDELTYVQSMELSINNEISFVPDENYDKQLEHFISEWQEIEEKNEEFKDKIYMDIVNHFSDKS
ncbi:MAG: hypothetical protein ACI4N3_04320 [Alphaproteobacteria bacterium]